MKQSTKYLIALFIIIVAVKLIITAFVPSPTVFADEYLYSKMARSLFIDHNFMNNGLPTHEYLPLYPIVISLAYIFQNSALVYFFMKSINVVLSSLIIFPIFFLAKDFLTRKKALFISFLISIIPMSFSISNYVMAENLFYPLIAFSVYFLYKSLKSNKRIDWIVSGIFVGLTLITKTTALAIVPIAFILFLFRKTKFTNILIHYIIVLIIALPWIIRNIHHFGFNFITLLGGDTVKLATESALWIKGATFLNIFILHLGFLLLASGIIFGIYYFLPYKKSTKLNNLYLIISIAAMFFVLGSTLITYSIPSSYDSPFFLFKGRILGRIMDSVLPFIILVGFINFNKREKAPSAKPFILSSVLLLFSSQLFVENLIPVNNQSLTLFGLISLATRFITSGIRDFSYILIPFLIFALILIIISLIVYSVQKNKKLTAIFVISFFILSSLGSFAITAYSSNNWYKNEQIQLGLEIDKLTDKNDIILYDKRDCRNYNDQEKDIKTDLCEIYVDGRAMAISGFFINKNIIVTDINQEADYIVSKHKLDLPIIKKTSNEIYLYKATGS